eukprot:scaffold54276_cov18-Tisochrysis_lutea.AAC.1
MTFKSYASSRSLQEVLHPPCLIKELARSRLIRRAQRPSPCHSMRAAHAGIWKSNTWKNLLPCICAFTANGVRVLG